MKQPEKAMILAAGFGTRLWPLTIGRTKPALPFLNRPLISFTIDYLRRYGFTDIIINLHHEPESVQDQIGDGSRFGVKISYSIEEPEILGTAGALDAVRDRLEGGTFVVINGKIITNIDLGAALSTHRQTSAVATLVLKQNSRREYFREVLVRPDGGLTGFGGFPDRVQSLPSVPLMFTGIHLLEPEIFDFPGGYQQSSDGSQYAEDRLDELQAHHQSFEASCNAQGVCTGHRLSLTRHPRDDQNADYLVTGTTLHLQQATSESGSGESRLSCSFTAIPAEQQFRPLRRTPKPAAPGPQTAIVTGPWAGKGWGGISIPRIGQEVVVDFVEGDPDQPLITGRVYNGEQMPPFDLPAGGVVSGIKSKSHKATGYNEFSMDDTAGKEMITVHGQFDMQSTIEHDQTLVVHNNRTDTIDVDDTESVGNDQKQTVGNNQSIKIGVNQLMSVGSNRTVTVGANESL
ncbi:MAG: hypothetical protein EBU88_02165, partial [Acidobacteria bacterium]|nr:hypothetical protein [Acidobacteriota bacterium]